MIYLTSIVPIGIRSVLGTLIHDRVRVYNKATTLKLSVQKIQNDLSTTDTVIIAAICQIRQIVELLSNDNMVMLLRTLTIVVGRS